jgi:superfamily II DNA or RNA helicase
MAGTQNENEPLFIVDNTDGGRNGLDYLSEWCELASSVDIATGYFEIGALLALDGEWQKLDKIRVLMGDEVSHRTKKAFLDAVTQTATSALDAGLERDKGPDPFLAGAPAVVEALKTGQVEVRVYNRDKFHAKAYITHGKFDVVGSQALVGSSNFTVPGLTENIELNIKVESGAEVAQLQRWYEKHWDDAVDVTPEILKTVERHTHEYTPFDVWARALHEMFAEHEESAKEWELGSSEMFPKLDRYQQEAYWAMMDKARQHNGAFLCDGVGLGKTFVGLMLIERLVVHERKRVVLFAPKAAKEAVWIPALKKHLAAVGGVTGGADFSNLVVFSHTDLTRSALDFPDRFARIAESADAVVIDEAHHFRNTGKNDDDWEEKSRYWRLFDLLGGSGDPKTLFMLTATPINNTLNDYRHMVELFSRGDDNYFARTIGVPSLAGRINTITKSLKQQVGDDSVAEHVGEAVDLLAADPIFSELVVQRSRTYAIRSQEQQYGHAAAFPDRGLPKVAEYSVRKTYGNLLKMVEDAFAKKNPLFALPIYYPLAYYIGPDLEIKAILENRQQQVVGLIRTNFLKRFESSVHAFEHSCDRLLRKLIAFVEVNSDSDSDKKVLQRFLDRHEELLAGTRARQLQFWPAGDEEDEEDDGDPIVISQDLLDAAELLDPSEYKVAEILAETYQDMEQLVDFLQETRKFEPKNDDKLNKLTRLLKSKAFTGRKVLVFTEFADTGRYLHKHLSAAGIDGLHQLDGSTKTNRAEVLRRFSPYYNGSSSEEIGAEGHEEIRVLIATDVLSEGLNLQDATLLINYDIHWNPVRLMQRIGRVDRRLDPQIEEAIKTDHPELANDRGKVAYWNFLPPGELETLLHLYQKVTHKTLLISKTLGIEHGKLLKPDDDFAVLREFNAGYEGEATEIEELHLEYQKLLADDPELEGRLQGFPGSVFSGRARSSDAPIGVFFCFRLPAYDVEVEDFTLEAGQTRWYFHDSASGDIAESATGIARHVRSTREDARGLKIGSDTLISSRKTVDTHIKNTYLRQIDAPLTAPDPKLVCWMELNG